MAKRRVVNLEGSACRPTAPTRRWALRPLDELRLHAGGMDLASYLSGRRRGAPAHEDQNPRLTQDKADWLARHWASCTKSGEGAERWSILGDLAHKVINANLFRADEALALYAAIEAPVLAVEASDDSLRGWRGSATRSRNTTSASRR